MSRRGNVMKLWEVIAMTNGSELYCTDCGAEEMDDVLLQDASEMDYPVHCPDCNCLIEHFTLSSTGVNKVKRAVEEYVLEGAGNVEVLQDWANAYLGDIVNLENLRAWAPLIGSVSTGSFRNEELLQAIIDACDKVKDFRTTHPELFGLFGKLDSPEEVATASRLDDIAAECEGLLADMDDELEGEERGSEMVNETGPDNIGLCLPTGYYYGSHEGNSSDIGIWFAAS